MLAHNVNELPFVTHYVCCGNKMLNSVWYGTARNDLTLISNILLPDLVKFIIVNNVHDTFPIPLDILVST